MGPASAAVAAVAVVAVAVAVVVVAAADSATLEAMAAAAAAAAMLMVAVAAAAAAAHILTTASMGNWRCSTWTPSIVRLRCRQQPRHLIHPVAFFFVAHAKRLLHRSHSRIHSAAILRLHAPP